ncbi:hypothetical protein ACFRJ8_06740 [Arthrobacter sp. NPDC056886]|uniref:hypothetical protein n=1 Tax=Arthrobacter sp. NPDC056886 TaxID=3345960 RepID=UPI003671B81A
MPPTPAPTPVPVEVFLHPSPAEWWQIVAALAPVAVLIAAAVGAFMAWQTLRQRAIADDRAEWWKRTQWALDSALDRDEDTRALGLAALEVLASSELARDEELELLDIAWKSVTGHEEHPAAQHIPVNASSPATASQQRVQVAAARLRVTLDRRLGRPTPDQTKARAKEEL